MLFYGIPRVTIQSTLVHILLGLITVGLSVARIHRKNCSFDFETFDIATGAPEINKLIAFIVNTTNDYTLIGLAAGAVKGHLHLLNDTFHSLGIPKIANITGTLTFMARPGYPNDTDYNMPLAVHLYAEQYVTILPSHTPRK